MFEHLTRAHREIPPVTWVEECDFTDVDTKRLLPLALKAVAESLQRVPGAERAHRRQRSRLSRAYDIGIAVQTEQGLVVPVVRDCDSRSLDELEAEVRAARRSGTGRKAHAGGAARRHVHRHERGQVGGPLRHAAHQPSAGGDPRRLPDRRSRRSCVTARSSCVASGMSPSRSTTV